MVVIPAEIVAYSSGRSRSDASSGERYRRSTSGW
jgi:hypothetical protein